MQKEYSDIQNRIIKYNIEIFNKYIEIKEINNIIKSIEINIINLNNNLEKEKFLKIKKIYVENIRKLKKEILLLNLYIVRKESYNGYKRKKLEYKLKF